MLGIAVFPFSMEKLRSCKQLRSKLGIGLNENQVFCFILSPASPRKFSVVSIIVCSIVYKFVVRCKVYYMLSYSLIVSKDIQNICKGRRFLMHVFNYNECRDCKNLL